MPLLLKKIKGEQKCYLKESPKKPKLSLDGS